VGVLVVRVQAHEVRRVVACCGDVAVREQGKCSLVEHGGGRACQVAALVLEPVFERRARAEGHPVEELVTQAGQSDRLQPRALREDLDVDRCTVP
jgi:hypothetical protein